MISLLLPSRGRPEGLERVASSALDTADHAYNVELVVFIDDDDPSYDGQSLPEQVRLFKTQRTVLSQYWNLAYQQAEGDIVMQCSDDLLFHTQGWDTSVRNAFEQYPDRIVLVFGDDGDPTHTDYGTHCFVHRRWVETLGYFVPPYFSADYSDTWLNELATAVNRKHKVPIVTEHMHFSQGKGTLDLTHAERLVRLWADDNLDKWARTVSERNRDALKLRAAMQ